MTRPLRVLEQHLVRVLIPVTVALAVGLSAGASAVAKSWPTPAAGASSSGGPELVLTFDDGPNPTTTPQVLDILAKHRIRAVFFMVGEMVDTRNKKVPAIVERILREGHVIANHTMKHKDLCRVKPEAAIEDLDRGKAAIEGVAGIPILWFRAPFGVRCERLEGMLAERGLRHFHWDLDPQEWKHGSKDQTVDYVTRALARATGRNVLLLHDIKPVTVAALPEILTWLDAENSKRAAAGKKPIRIVPAPEIAFEQLAPGLTAWAADATARIASLRTDLASVLP